ncbi:hypothetical protein AZA_37464 [Nitrospirillum viridazoti Y2]|uniref:Cytochrome c oxidase subunit 4 n=1 Tax=Nitrospirillum amazonense TaxID=28077 RepID=A0A560IBG8_9PROT|nr:hypothetical protein [Nitrospirillum amazonense]EGY01606.1 hypothetical protein AZA_37464 [Nitrospirillum amazonense Y2]TWB56398.1 cytochrome c oxidase subunit 4 [Nitrospirillum amazonense]
MPGEIEGVGVVLLRRSSAFVAVLLSLCVALIYARLQTQGHDWGDDFGLYLQYASNIWNGRPINYLNSQIQVPPGFSFLFAILSPLHGWDFQYMKMVQSAFIGIFGVAAYFLARQYVSPLVALLVCAATVANEAVFFIQQSLIPDTPFSAIITLSLVATSRLCFLDGDGGGADRRQTYWMTPWPGLLVLAALMMKPAGMTIALATLVGLFAALVVGRTRGASRPVALALTISLISIVYYYVAWNASSGDFVNNFLRYLKGYDSIVVGIASFVWTGLQRELGDIRVLLLWFSGTAVVANLLTIVAFASAIWVLLRRRGAAPVEWFMLAHFGLMILTPWGGGPRYLLPLLPLLFLHVAYCLETGVGAVLGRSAIAVRSPNIALIAPSAIAVLALVPIIWHGANEVYGNRHTDYNEIDKPDVKDLVAWLDRNTTDQESFCSFKPRAMMYLTSRRTCYSGAWQDKSLLSEYIRKSSAKYFVVMSGQKDNPDLESTRRAAADTSLCVVFENGSFRVYGKCDQSADAP